MKIQQEYARHRYYILNLLTEQSRFQAFYGAKSKKVTIWRKKMKNGCSISQITAFNL